MLGVADFRCGPGCRLLARARAAGAGRRFGCRLGVIGRLPALFGLALSRQHRDVERGAPVLGAEVSKVVLGVLRLRSRALCVHPEHRLARRIGEPDLAEAPLPRRSHAGADELQAAVAGGFGESLEIGIAHSVSTTCSTRPTSPPTIVPLIRIYWRSRPTAASSRLVTVCASQPRTVSDTSFTMEPP